MQSDESSERLGNRIARLRHAKGWNQRELAQRAGTQGQQISRYERGNCLPKLDALARIAEALETTMDYLLHGHEPQQKPDPRIRALVTPLERLPDEARAHVTEFLEALLKACEMVQRYQQQASSDSAPKQSRGRPRHHGVH